jgi:NAD(P)-dependent dehydrogenase (short-subunit alcohol dehydrogenase family)
MDTSLRGKCAIVTGAASGIGRAAAEALAASGTEVVGLDLNVVRAGFDIIGCDVEWGRTRSRRRCPKPQSGPPASTFC